METAAQSQQVNFDTLLNGDPAEFDRRLEVLLASVDDLLRSVILRTLRSHFAAHSESIRENIDDLAAETVLILVRKVHELRRDCSTEPIQNFPAYAATVASNVCYAYLRKQHPEWTRLKNQVRYIAAHDPGLVLRESGSGTLSCVMTELNTAKEPVLPVTIGPGDGVNAYALPLRGLIKTIIRNAGHPVELNELVKVIAELRGVRDSPAPVTKASETFAERLADPRPVRSPDDISFLRQVWEEVQRLPPRQRIALLLNLRDDRGRGVLALFPVTAVAALHQIAEVLEMPAEELAQLWNDLPIDDFKIAERLGITRQQVINLRKAGRARLARRLARRT